MRQLVSTAVVALIVGALAGATAGALAQTGAGPDGPSAAAPARDATARAGIDADTVDGIHAVRSTGLAARRANRLVATNAAGLLPANIVKPRWSLINGIPAGFADGVDDGVRDITVTQVEKTGNSFGPGTSGYSSSSCPSGTKLVGGGFQAGYGVTIFNSYQQGTGTWFVEGFNTTPSAYRAITAYALCLGAVRS